MTALWTKIDLETADLSQFSGNVPAYFSSTAAAATGAAKNGSYGMECVGSVAGGLTQVGGHKLFTEAAGLVTVIDAWFRWTSITTAADGSYAGAHAAILVHKNNGAYSFSTATEQVWLSLVQSLGTPALKLMYLARDGTHTLVGGTYGGFHTHPLNTWYLNRLIIDRSGANPVITWKQSTDGVNFTQLETETDSTSGSSGLAAAPNTASFGVQYVVNFESFDGTVQFDDMAGYDAEPSAGGGVVLPIFRHHYQQQKVA